MVGFWDNMVKNYDEDVRDDAFFSIVRNFCDHDQAVELIETAYSESELKAMHDTRYRNARLDLMDPLDDVFQTIWNHEENRDKCRLVLYALRDLMLANLVQVKNELIERRLKELSSTLKLNELESEILALAYCENQTCFSWPSRIDDRDKPMYFAMALDRSLAEVQAALAANGKLRKFEILDNDWDFAYRNYGGYLNGADGEALERRFYHKVEGETLPWSYYGDLAAKDGEILKSMIKASVGKGKCNILFYGVPGTGKSSFAKTLIHELGSVGFEIKQGDTDGRNMNASSRMVGIQVANDKEDPNESVLIVDEADELLRSTSAMGFFDFHFGGGKSTEKGVMNTLLDEMKLPAIWISNAPAEYMDESVRRRFDYSICFERMTNAQRQAIWRNLVDKHGLKQQISEEQIALYADKYQTSAGGISVVLENVKRMRPAREKIDGLVATLMKPHCRLMGIASAEKFMPAKGYSIDGLNVKGKVSPAKIVMSARNYLDATYNAEDEDRPRMNVLLFGPPGTGKTEFVKYLGKELDRRVIVVKGSDLLSKYVGESEQNIAAVFRRAESERAVLFFDEIDGLLQDRANAGHSWEITQVNELLQQMENFDGIMVAATNFSANLDSAVMRRFTFKLEFDYLDAEGKRKFFEKMFKSKLSESERTELESIPNLAPGDFRTVRQEQFYLGGSVTNGDRLEALREESRLKKDGAKVATVGF